MHTDIVPNLTDPITNIEACQAYLARCEELRRHAQTAEAERLADLWLWNAEAELRRWQAAADRQVQR